MGITANIKIVLASCNSARNATNSSVTVIGMLPPVQKAAFALFPSLVPLQTQELWPELLDGLIQLIKPHLLEGQLHQQLQQQLQQQQQVQLQAQRQGSFSHRGPAAPSSNNNSLHRPALSSLSMEKALEILLQLYRYEVHSSGATLLHIHSLDICTS